MPSRRGGRGDFEAPTDKGVQASGGRGRPSACFSRPTGEQDTTQNPEMTSVSAGHPLLDLVGREGFEPPTPCASCRCSSRSRRQPSADVSQLSFP